jgi:hypothetical protein
MRLTLLVALGLCSTIACAGSPSPEFRDGDIIFHTSKSAQSEALQRAMHSPYSHMGIIFIQEGKPVVLEAVGPVKYTPAQDWIDRGVGAKYAVKRLADAETVLTPEAVARLRDSAESYLGLPYDSTFEWSDDKIYCSELVWKAYERTLGIELGDLETLSDFDLTDPLVQAKFHERFGDTFPADEPVISPRAIFASPALETLYEN